MKPFTTILTIALAAICSTGYAQNDPQIIVPKGSASASDEPIIDDDNTVYTSVKIMPEFPGGEAAIKKYFADNLSSYKTPKLVKGKVFVQFVIGKDGIVETENVKVISGVEPKIDEEVVSLVKNMPKWSPGLRYESKSGKVVKVLARVSMNIPVEISIEGEKGEEVFFIVEHMPEFPGGDLEMRKFIANNIIYPKEAISEGIQGKVFVQFIIDKNGDVVSPKIARSIDPLLDAEAIRVVQSMPKWTPGSQRGKTVNVSFTVPIEFKL